MMKSARWRKVMSKDHLTRELLTCLVSYLFSQSSNLRMSQDMGHTISYSIPKNYGLYGFTKSTVTDRANVARSGGRALALIHYAHEVSLHVCNAHHEWHSVVHLETGSCADQCRRCAQSGSRLGRCLSNSSLISLGDATRGNKERKTRCPNQPFHQNSHRNSRNISRR